jgi:hypothetical protein
LARLGGRFGDPPLPRVTLFQPLRKFGVGGALLITPRGGSRKERPLSLNSEIEQVVLMLLLVLVLEKSRYLSVTLTERNGARRFGPCFDAQSQQIEHEHDDEHEHDF